MKTKIENLIQEIRAVSNRESLKTVLLILIIVSAVGLVVAYRVWKYNNPPRIISIEPGGNGSTN